MSTPLNRVLELVINGDLPGGLNALLKSKTSSDTQTPRMRLIAGNRFTVRLYFRKPATAIGAPSTVYDLATPNSLVFAGKKDDQTIEGDTLFSVAEWAKIGNEESAYYQGMLDLKTAAVAALFASGPDEVPVSVDIQFRDLVNSERLTWRAELTLCRPVYDGVGILPSTLSASYLQSPDGSTWKFSINDDGQTDITKIGLEQRDPAFAMIQYATFITPGGYYYTFSIDDNGQESIRRIQ